MIHDWIEALKPAKNLHMRELRWNKQQKRIVARLAKLGPIPHKYNLRPVAAKMKWQDYRIIVEGKINGRYTHPYIICALCCISTVLVDLAKNDDVYFWLDRQEGLHRESMEELRNIVFNWFRADRRVLGIEFMERNRTVCLDPADYLAYVVRERSIDPLSFKARAGASIIGSPQSGKGGWISPEALHMLVDWHTKERPIEEVVSTLIDQRYFLGPKS